MQDIVTIFSDLVRIDSPSGHEFEVAKYLKKWLEKLDFSAEQDNLGNVIAFHPGEGDPILLCAHMDTVEPGKGIIPIENKGIIKSAGNTILGADNKAAIAAIMCSVEKYLTEEKKPRAIEILFTVKEETGGGVEFFDFKIIRSKIGFIFDISDKLGGIAIASPYIYNFRLTFSGKAAHAKHPEKGRNALLPAIKFIADMRVGKFDRGKTYINVGNFSGGTGINIVPDKVFLAGEIRCFDKDLFESHLKDIRQKAAKSVQGTGVRMECAWNGYCSGYAFSKKEKNVKAVGDILKKRHIVKYLMMAGVSDANPLNGAGIKTINISDGTCDAHSTEESISVKNLQGLEAIIYDLLKKFKS